MAAKQPPPLMKKHSQTDLVSRLKTRKILGVGGEDDDGEVHRSKISQVLGNEIKFAVREPLGLRVWQFASAVLFSGIAIMVSPRPWPWLWLPVPCSLHSPSSWHSFPPVLSLPWSTQIPWPTFLAPCLPGPPHPGNSEPGRLGNSQGSDSGLPQGAQPCFWGE
uniref:Tumor protein p53-inducible protein 11 n=1 Tax=Suricata suricatta TaxID=37032 RepID=A0A673TWR9_SURSU